MIKNNSIIKIIRITLLTVSVITLNSCKDDSITNAYLHLTENLRDEEFSVLKSENINLKMKVKDLYTDEPISGAQVSLSFSNGYSIVMFSGKNGLIEIDRKLIPDLSFDIAICYTKDNVQYFLNQRFFYNENQDKANTLYVVRGNCGLK